MILLYANSTVFCEQTSGGSRQEFGLSPLPQNLERISMWLQGSSFYLIS